MTTGQLVLLYRFFMRLFHKMNVHIVFGVLFITFINTHSATDDFFKCNSYITSEEDMKVFFNCASLEGLIVHSNYFDESKEINWDYSCETSSLWKDNHKIPYINASEIVFNRCQFTHMPSVFFHRFGKVNKIQIDCCSIEMIDNEACPKNCSLERLVMSFNQLTELPPFLFSHTPNISEINFSHNQISYIHSNTFREHPNKLKVINLSNNHIETLDKLLLSDLLNLEVLDLSYNYIQDFQIALSKLKNLSILRLDNNKIKQLHCENVFNLATASIHIDVSRNSLKEIDLNWEPRYD